jgi:hypothetical protein
MQTLTILRPYLTYFASTAGGGVAAFALIEWLRRRFPLVQGRTNLFYTLLYAPAYARYTALILAALISVLASVALAAIQGGDVLTTADTALAAAIAAILSQVLHAGTSLPTEPVQPIEPIAPVQPQPTTWTGGDSASSWTITSVGTGASTTDDWTPVTPPKEGPRT